MEVYIILIVGLLLQAMVLSVQGKNYNKLFFILAYLEVVFVAGFRLSVGGDTEAYVDFFNQVCQTPLSDFLEFGYEPGFVLFCYLLSVFGCGSQIIIFFSTALITFLVFNYIYRNSKIVWLSIVLYITLMFFFNSMNVMRAAMAYSILLYTSSSIVNRKCIHFFLIVLLASTFHFSAIFFICIYFLYPLRISKKYFLLMIFIPFVINIIFMPFFDAIISVHERYSSYRSGTDEFYQSSIANYLILGVNMTLLLFVWYYEDGSKSTLSGERKMYMCALLLSVLAAIVAINIMMFTRFVTMFSLFSIIYVPNVLYNFRKKVKYYYWISILLLVTILQVIVILLYRPEWYLVTPYYNYLFT